MNLDKRIKKGKTYLDCFDIEKAKNFIGKECYLSNDVTPFANINNLHKAVLKEVDEEAVNPYTLENTRWRYSSNFILPCEWVKPEEPECRPYTDKEFLTLFDLGKFHSIRIRSEPYSRVIITSIYYIDNILYIRMNGDKSEYDVMWLFRHCEYLDGDEWKPFGI